MLVSLGHPCKFQRVSRLAFVTAATSLTGGQPNFARCMAVSWPGTLYTFGISCLLTEFCHVQNLLSVHLRTIAQISRAISLQLRHLSTIGKSLLNSNMSYRCPHNMVNFGLLAPEIGPVFWGTPANFNWYRV